VRNWSVSGIGIPFFSSLLVNQRRTLENCTKGRETGISESGQGDGSDEDFDRTSYYLT